MKRLLRKLRFAWPDIMDGSPSREEYEYHVEKERREREKLRRRIRALEADYGIPGRKENDGV